MKVVSLRRGEDERSELWSPEPRGGGDDGRDQGEMLWQVIGVLRRRWLIILPTAAIVFAISYVSAALSPREYTATSMVMINPGREQVINDQELVNRTNPTDVVVESEISVIKSPSTMRRVVDDLRLEEDPEWNPALQPPDALSVALAPLFGGLRPPLRVDQLTPEDRDALRAAIARGLPNNINVWRRQPSYVLMLEATAPSARGAAELANGLAEAYLQSQTESQFAATQRANEWLSQRVRELAADVQAKERAAEEYRVQHGLSLAAGGAEQELSTDAQGMLGQARADLTEKEARLRQVEQLIAQGGSADLIAGAANSSLITTLRANEAELQRRQTDLEQRYGELHPDVQAGRVELENLHQRIQAEIARITTGLRNEVEISRRRLAALQGNFGAETGRFDSNNDAVIQYRQLLREAQAARTVHQSFLQRFQEVESQQALPLTTARLVSAASPPPAPSSPNMTNALRISLLLALGLGVGLAYLIELLDGSVAGVSEIERKLSANATASIPRLKDVEYRTLPPQQRHPAGYLVEKPMSEFAEAFRVIRASVMHARVDAPVKVVAVTSALAEEGKTTVSLCLARIAALAGQKVVLVDCDLRRQTLSELLGEVSPPQHGLLDVLMNKVPWRNAVTEDADTQAHILMGPRTEFSPLDLFSSQAMAQLLTDLRASYDLVVLDCPPVLHVADARTAAGLADLALMVVRARKTPAAAARTAMAELDKAGAQLHGVVLNRVTPETFGSGAYSNALYYGGSYKNKYYST